MPGLLAPKHGQAAAALPGGSQWFWLIGVLATLIGSTLTVCGFLLQKLAHAPSDASASHEEQRPYWMRRRWIIGLGLWLAGQAIDFPARGLADQSLLACFNCWNIAVVFLLAPRFVGERPNRQSWLAAAVLVVGCVWMITAGPKEYKEQTMATLGEAARRPDFLFMLAAIAVLVVAAAACHCWGGLKRLPWAPPTLLAAVCAWAAVLCAKCLAALAVTSARGGETAAGSVGLAVLGAAVIVMLNLCLLHLLNMAFRLGEAMVVLPTYESLSATGQLVVCAVFFGELRAFGALALFNFWTAWLFVLLGVVLVVNAQEDSSALAAVFGERAPLYSDMRPSRGSV